MASFAAPGALSAGTSQGVPPFWTGFRHKTAAKFRAQGDAVRPRKRARLVKKWCPWRALEQRNSRIFSRAKTRRFGAPLGEMSDFPGSKSPDFQVFWVHTQTHRHTDRQRTSGPGGTPPPRRKISARGWTLAPPHSNNLSAPSGAEKMEYFITFPASALVWKAFLGTSSGHFWRHLPPRGPFPWAPARGYPPFGPVFGIK